MAKKKLALESTKEAKKISSLEERKKRRWAVVIVLLVTVFSSVLFSFFRLLPSFWQKIMRPKIFELKREQTKEKSSSLLNLQRSRLQKKVENYLFPYEGIYGLCFYDLQQDEGFALSGERSFPAASLIKLPVAFALYRQAEEGKISLEEKYSLQEKDKIKGSGVLYLKPAGEKFTYRELAELMLNKSDTTAQLILAEKIGRSYIQQTVEDLGMQATDYKEGETTPIDVTVFFYRLLDSSFLSSSSREEILSFLTKTIFEEQIPAGLPQEAIVAHKVGIEKGVLSDAGIISYQGKRFILVILSDQAPREEAEKVLPAVTRLIWQEID